MTIKVEQEALLRLLTAPPSTPPLEPPISCYDDRYHIDFHKPVFSSGGCPVGKLRDSLCDDDSVFTASTASLSSDSDDDDLERRVSFAQPLVTVEWTREYTPKDEIGNLYYSTEETQR